MSEITKTISERPIRRMLRRKESQDYFTGDGWTGNIDEAKTFSDALEAVQTCLRWRLENVEIVLRVNGASHDLFCTDIWVGQDHHTA